MSSRYLCTSSSALRPQEVPQPSLRRSGRSKQFADSTPWLRLAAAVRFTHSLCNRESGGVGYVRRLRRRPIRLQASAAFTIAAEPQSQRYAARYATGRASAARGATGRASAARYATGRASAVRYARGRASATRASAARYARAYRSCDSPVAMFEALTYLRASAALSARPGQCHCLEPRSALQPIAVDSGLSCDCTHSATALSAVRCVESIGVPTGGMGHALPGTCGTRQHRTRRMQRPSGLRARPQSRPTRRAQCT
jgi:hypothetical protein